jgi:hypothetical protein
VFIHLCAFILRVSVFIWMCMGLCVLMCSCVYLSRHHCGPTFLISAAVFTADVGKALNSVIIAARVEVVAVAASVPFALVRAGASMELCSFGLGRGLI